MTHRAHVAKGTRPASLILSTPTTSLPWLSGTDWVRASNLKAPVLFLLSCDRRGTRLGFVRAGLIPKAGLLRTEDGMGEEYVDAVVFWKEF
jgi:hypothetical protein